MAAPDYLRFTRRQWLLGMSGAALFALPGRSQTASGSVHSRVASYKGLEKFILPGSDDFSGEKAAEELKAALSDAFAGRAPLPVAPGVKGVSPCPVRYRKLADDVSEAIVADASEDVRSGWAKWRESLGEIRRAQFYVLPDDLVRYEVASGSANGLKYRVGFWRIQWEGSQIRAFAPVSEHLAQAAQPWFRDVTQHVLGASPDLRKQFGCGIPYWRSRLDPACGIDIYGSNGIAVGDIDGDGRDEVYVCQPGGLPNRLLKIGFDGVAADLTESWGVGLLDDTSCALFVDLRNSGSQDLIVLRSTGPVLFVNEGGRYRMFPDAFRFARPPRGNFTGMAAADYDRDGRLDLYLCCYVYFQSEAQYTYASPYHDAENGPPNFLFRNRLTADGGGFFEDVTVESGIDQNNNRFSFAPAWCDYDGDGWPDLYVANDFGRKNLYRNRGGKFSDVAAQAGVEDIGPGMSASWFDFDGDSRADLYVANMWTDAGQRVTRDSHFKPAVENPAAYRKHTMGNSLFRNTGNGEFENVTQREDAAFGRWAWSSGGYDLNNDGEAEIFVTCGMLSNESSTDLNGFFWRQVVAQSPLKAGRSSAYENGWNALNQFAREDYSWSGHEPNVLHVRRGAKYFDFSGVSGLDLADDGRAFAVFDFDGDGRPDILLKSRLGPQLRILQNNCAEGMQSIVIRLQGRESNRDAIGTKVQVNGQTKWLEAGSGFLSQHSKHLIFGLGKNAPATVNVKIVWPSGASQNFQQLSPGRSYLFVEGEGQPSSLEALRPHHDIVEGSLLADNSLRLEDTWLLDPVPLPSGKHPAGLFVVREWSDEFAIFRRYLFDWRTELKPPIAFLLNDRNEAVKVYGSVPSQEQVRADMRVAKPPALPFDGFYVQQPRRDFFKFGGAYLWAGMPDKALPYLQRVLERTPDNARVLVLTGQIYLEQDQVDKAAEVFAKALEIDSTSANARIGLGDVAARKEQDEEAAEQYLAALKVDPKSPEAANGLGLALGKQNELVKAQAYFEQAIAERRDYAEAINNLAVLFSKQGKMNDAIAAWNYGIQQCPTEAILYLNLGRAYVNMGQFDKARVAMQELLDRDANNQVARRALQELSGR